MERLEVEEERKRRQQLTRVLKPAGAVTPPQASRRRRGRQHGNAVGKKLKFFMKEERCYLCYQLCTQVTQLFHDHDVITHLQLELALNHIR